MKLGSESQSHSLSRYNASHQAVVSTNEEARSRSTRGQHLGVDKGAQSRQTGPEGCRTLETEDGTD